MIQERSNSGLGLDIHSLAAFRILLSSSLLWDLVRYKAGLFRLLLSPDRAMFSVDDLHTFFGYRAVSVFDWISTPGSATVFLIFAGLVYVLLLAGYRSRIFSVVAFFCFWNLAQRTSVFYNPSDMLTGSLLFIGMFLPLDRALSVVKTNTPDRSNIHFSPFTVLLIFQIALVYFMMSIGRLGAPVALHHASGDLLYLKPMVPIEGFPSWIVSTLQFSGIALCLLVPAALLCAVLRVRGRWAAIAAIMILAISKLIFTWSGNWFLISMATAAILLPPGAWKRSRLVGTFDPTLMRSKSKHPGWMQAAALIIGWLILHQNAMSLAQRPGKAAGLMKKFKITRILKLTNVPSVEKASIFNQDWIRNLPPADWQYGRFSVEAPGGQHAEAESRTFKNYCYSGLAVWRNEMDRTDIKPFLSAWLRYESRPDAEAEPAIYYENATHRILMLGKQGDWLVSDWAPSSFIYKYKGPVGKITKGYGSKGTNVYRTYEKEHHGFTLMVYGPVLGKPVPVVLFTHAFFGHNYQLYQSLMEHVASWGYAFAFVPYRKGVLNKDAEDRRLRYEDVWEGFNDVMTTLPDVVDRERVVVAGHSYGGGAAASLAVKIFTETTWGSEAGGIAYFCPGYMEDIDQSDLESLRGDLQLMAQVYDMDTVTGPGMAWEYCENAGLADSNKLFLVVDADEVDGFNYLANHYVPLQIGPNQYFDAYDYYAVFRPLNAFLLSIFEKDEAAYKYLYDRKENAVLNMGPQLKPMRLMTEYFPLKDKDWYWAPCDHPGNPRREFCP